MNRPTIKLKVVEEWGCPTYTEVDRPDKELENSPEYQHLSYWVVEWDEDEYLITNFIAQFQTASEANAYMLTLSDVALRLGRGE